MKEGSEPADEGLALWFLYTRLGVSLPRAGFHSDITVLEILPIADGQEDAGSHEKTISRSDE